MKFTYLKNSRCVTFDSFIYKEGNNFALHRLSGCAMPCCVFPHLSCNRCFYEL